MNENKAPARARLKIGELARASGVSVSTLKFYVKEGLIRPVCKSGRNMAWYSPECVSTIRAIRMLQKERFYPLSVIKRLLESPERSEVELELLDAIHKVDYKSSGARTALGEAVRQTHLSAAQIARLAEEGLIAPGEEGRRAAFTDADLTVMTLVRRRMDAGIPFEQSVRAFAIYAGALREAAKSDVDALIAGAILAPDFTAEAGARMIRVSDETLEVFVSAKRKEFNREYGSGRLEELYRFEQRLAEALRRMSRTLGVFGLSRDAAHLEAALDGAPSGVPLLDEAAGVYRRFARGAEYDIAGSIAGCLRSREYFTALDPLDAGSAALAAACMKLCWLALAPDVLACADRAALAAAEFRRFLPAHVPDQAAALETAICAILTDMGGSI